MTKQSFDNNGDQLIKKWLNSDPQIKHLTLRAVKSLPHKLSEISEALENNSYKKAAFKVHNLKGLALNFKLKEIYVITDKLNKELKEENYEIEKIESLYQELDQLIKTIPESYL